MVNYEVTVSTGKLVGAATFNDVFIKLVGTDGESERVKRTLPPTSGTVSLKYPSLRLNVLHDFSRLPIWCFIQCKNYTVAFFPRGGSYACDLQ